MEHLGARLSAGDRAAFAELYGSCADRLHHYLTVRLRSRQDADDVLQETFVRLAGSRHKLRSVKNLVAYVFTVARNEASRLGDRRRREPIDSESLSADVLFDPSCLDEVSRRETAELVARAMGELPPSQREVIELKFFAGLTFREIADITESPQGTVATRHRTGLKQLQRMLTKQLP